jgi:hypothetical protein
MTMVLIGLAAAAFIGFLAGIQYTIKRVESGELEIQRILTEPPDGM